MKSTIKFNRAQTCCAVMAAVLVAASALGAAATLRAQSPAPGSPAKDPAAIVKMIAAQQDEIAANHRKIEEKLTLIEEEVRKANIYVSRGGAKAK